MRPLFVKIQAFGPYPDYVEVDFTKLGRNGLFLITGDTGAGKTTIFDAISYALYNDVNGSDRSVDMVRCKSADNSTPTYVELTFEKGDNTYVVRRCPNYHILDSKGKDKKVLQKVELTIPGKPVMTQWKETNAELVKIIGLEFGQYSQIAMIAQGEFRKFLMADSKDKSAIFSKLFDTKIYEDIQYKLSEKSKIINAEIDSKNTIINEKVNEIVCDESSTLMISVKDAKEKKLPPDEIVVLLGKIIDQDNEKLMSLNEEEKAVNDQITEAKLAIEKLVSQNKLLQNIEEYKKQISEIKPKEEANRIKLKELESKKDEYEEIKRKATVITEKLADYDVLDSNNAMLTSIKSAITELTSSLNSYTDKLSKLEVDVKASEDTLTKLNDVELNYQKTFDEYTKTGESIDNLLDLQKSIKEHKALLESSEKAKLDYVLKSDKAKKAEDDYTSVRNAFLDAQAGIIASEKLIAGKPCPVCGGLDHKCPAVLSPDAPTQEIVDKKEQEKNRLLDLMVSASNVSSKIQGQVDTSETTIMKDINELLGDISIDDAEVKIPEKLTVLYTTSQNLKDELKNLSEQVIKKETINKELPSKKKLLEDYKSKVTDVNNSLIANNKDLENITKTVIDLKAKFEYSSKEEASKAAASFNKNYRNYIDEMTSLEKSINDSNTTIKSLEAAIEEAKKGLSDEKIDYEYQKNLLDSLEKKKKEIKNLANVYTTNIGINKGCKTSIESKYSEINTIYEKSIWLKELTDTANGSLKNSVKMNLVAYVQAYYLDIILVKTNSRLLDMTDSQYELIRQTQADDKRSQFGLNIAVIDHYTNSIREVGSLSGGEKFLASLALALGVSDVIQENNGGVKLDSMFIDEGFGSLDTDTISKAYKALSSLSQGDRMVGLISHVDEIKSKIDKQIIVRKTNMSGRKIDIVV